MYSNTKYRFNVVDTDLENVVAVAKCASNPCMNGAKCVDGVDSYNCRCESSYTGVICESKPVFVLFVMCYIVFSNHSFLAGQSYITEYV